MGKMFLNIGFIENVLTSENIILYDGRQEFYIFYRLYLDILILWVIEFNMEKSYL